MAAMNATTTGAGPTLGAAERRPWSPGQLMGRILARISGAISGATILPDGGAQVGVRGPDHARQVRDTALWTTRSGRLS